MGVSRKILGPKVQNFFVNIRVPFVFLAFNSGPEATEYPKKFGPQNTLNSTSCHSEKKTKAVLRVGHIF